MFDSLLALWAVSLCAVGAFAYFRGAKRQLEKCLKLRHCDWMTDSRWEMEADISKKRFPN